MHTISLKQQNILTFHPGRPATHTLSTRAHSGRTGLDVLGANRDHQIRDQRARGLTRAVRHNHLMAGICAPASHHTRDSAIDIHRRDEKRVGQGGETRH